MICPNCNTLCADSSHFCNICGTPLSAAPPARKGSHWVPILILVVLSVLGTVLFFATEDLGSTNSSESTFLVRGGVLTFNESYYDGPAEVTVPEQVDGMTVHEIGDSCFSGCEDITTVVLPETVITIGSYAFENCASLRGIFLPESVEFISAGAFYGCSDLEAIRIPASTVYIAPDAFDGCSSLEHIFYDGTYEQWLFLYGPYLDPGVHIYCTDGNY